MKQTLAMILIVLLLCTVLAPSVLAAEEPAASPQTEVSAVPDSFDYTGSVISFTAPDAFGSTFDMECGDTGFTQLHSALDSVDLYGTVEKANTSYSLSLSVTWDFSTVDAETPGSYTAVGSISIPEGAALADGLENTVSISVQVTAPVSTVSPAAITLTRFDEPDRTDAVAFAVGTSQEELSDWFADSTTGFTGYDADGNPYDLVSGAWSLDAVDTATTGVYYAFTAPNLGTEYTLADGVSLPRQLCAVSIQVPGEPDINCCVAGRGFLHFPWVLSAAQEEQLDEFNLWLRQDGGEWTSLSDGFLFASDGLQLSQRIFTNGSTYELKVTYPGGQTGVLTFQYDGELSILDYSGGDRDGGDTGGSGSGTGTQPAPTTPQTPDHSDKDDNQSGGNNTPAPDDSSSEAGDTPQDSGATSHEPQKPQEGQGSTSGETQPTEAATQTPSDSQSNDSHNNDGNSQDQIPVTEKPTAVTPAAGAESAVPVYSDTSLSHGSEGTSPASVNHTVLQPKDDAEAVMNPVPDGNDTQSEKSSESQQSANLTEFYSPTQTVISGLRLRDLCADGENVVFGSGNLTVSIQSKLLLALNLTDSDTLSVKLTQPESNQILLAVEISGKSVTQLSGTVLRLRYIPQSENAEITVRNEAGEQITDASYDGGLLRFAANTAGTYTILEQSNTQETRKDTLPLLPVSGGLILAAGGITFFRRKCHG